MSESQISLIDITLSCERNTYANVRKFLDGWCKQWIFQKEKSDSGYEHWQLRVSTTKKRRIAEHIYKWRGGGDGGSGAAGIVFAEQAVTPTSNSVFGGAARKVFQYVLKEDTRTEGPWSDRDEVKVSTKSVVWIKEHGLLPWQNSIIDSCKTYNHREINVLVDKGGNLGKTAFEDYLSFEDIACDIWFGPVKDMTEEAYEMRGKSAYTINLPRALNKKEMNDFWCFVEHLKDGRVREPRYKSKRLRFERPVIWIFTNDRPCLKTQSMDRWRFWTVNKDKELVDEATDEATEE